MSPAEPLDEESAFSRVSRALGAGLLLTLAQIFLACLVGTYSGGSLSVDPPNLLKAYFSLVQYDSQWYWCIADEGYRTDKVFQKDTQGNVAFFPGYPLAVQGLYRVTGWPMPLCLLLVAQAACWGFWTYFLLLLDRFDVPPGQARLASIFLVSQPAAFFLVAGYSESLFLFGLLGFIYWSDSEHPALKWIGVLHGILMTGTRLVGLPLVIYPVVRALFRRDEKRRVSRIFGSVILAVVSSLGALGFFAYCQTQFGAWNLYFETQKQGWLVQPNYLALGDPTTWTLSLQGWIVDGFLSPDWLSKVVVPIFVVVSAILVMIEFYLYRTQPEPHVGDRLGYFLLAFLMFFISSAGLFGNAYRSMIRYIFCSEVLLALQIAHLVNNEDLESDGEGSVLVFLLWILILGSFVTQAFYLHRFTHGQWVA